MDFKLSNEKLESLFTAIMSLDSVEECRQFFTDLCTISELKAMEQRFHVAQLLDKQFVYSDIVKETSASTATISRVNRSLEYGAGGYRVALDRMKEKSQQE